MAAALCSLLFVVGTQACLGYSSFDSGVERVLHDLAAQQWGADELVCRDRLFNMLENVKNSTLWASWAWDSMPQGPLGTFYGSEMHLGNYDQCLKPPWLATNPELRQQYCLVDVDMSRTSRTTTEMPGPHAKAQEYVNFETQLGRRFSRMRYGVCLPAGCAARSVETFVRTFLSTSHLQAARGAAVTVLHCEQAGRRAEPSTGYYVYWYIFTALCFTAVASAYYERVFPATAGKNTFANHVARSFCLRRNWANVFKQEDVTCMNGIRCVIVLFEIHAHIAIANTSIPVINALDAEKPATFLDRLPHRDLFVDSFFAMSALLLGISLTAIDVTNLKNLIKNILKRYIRLIGMVAVTAAYLEHVAAQRGEGPLLARAAGRQRRACERSSWLAWLMLGNYFNTSHICNSPAWYVYCDFHMHVITLLLLFVYRRNPRMGSMAAGLVLLAGLLAPPITTYLYDLPAILLQEKRLQDTSVIGSKTYLYRYIKTHNRMGPFAAGLLVGYVMSIYKPKEQKKVWSKTLSSLGACASLCVSAAVLGAGGLCAARGVRGLAACVFVLFNRTTFAASVLALIVFCTYGDVPVIKPLLSWPVFAPLGRLTYGVYLINSLVIMEYKMSVKSYSTVNSFGFAVELCGLTAVSLAGSLAARLLVEAPLFNLTGPYINTRSRAKMDGVSINEPTSNRVVLSDSPEKPKLL